MKNKEIKLKYILPPIIFFMFIIFISILTKKFPFGDNSWFTSDYYHQYQAYIAEFRQKILSFNGMKEFFFSNTTPMGSNYWTEFSYYCSSPLNLLLIIIPQSLFNYSINALLILKLLLIPICFNFYINKKYNLNTTNSIILTLSYSFSAFFIYNLWNIIWLECFALFPLIILNLEKGIKENKWELYTLFLFLSIWCNFYISFIICIGIVFYFLINVKYDKTFFKTFVNFAFHSIIAGLLNSILLIPLYLELVSGNGEGFAGFKFYDNFINILSYSLPLGNVELISSNLSNTKSYIGLLPLFILPYYFINKENNKKEKYLYTFFLLFMFLSFNTEPLNYIWHGFHHPEGITNRFVFLFTFMIIDICGKILNNKEYIKFNFKLFLIQSIIFILIAIFSDTEKMCLEITSFFLIIYLLYTIILKYIKEDNIKRIKYINKLMCITLCTELMVCSLIYCMSFKTNTYSEANNNELTKFISTNIDNKEFYRTDIKRLFSDNLEFKESYSMNIEKSLNLQSISGFSSILNKNLKRIERQIGIQTNSITIKDDFLNPISSNLFSVKYLINKKDNNLVHINTMFSPKTENENYILYENKYFTKPIIKIKNDINNKPNENPFINLNDIAKSFSGINEDIFEIIDNIEYKTSINKDVKDKKETVYKRHYEYIIEFSGLNYKDFYLMLPFIKDSSMQLIYKNDKIIHSEYTYGFLSTLQIGKLKPEDKIKIIYFIPDNKDVDLKDFFIYFANFNEDNYKKHYNIINNNSYNMNLDKNKINFKINENSDNLYYISMANHDGWKAYVDGKEVEIIPTLYKSMLGINIPSGEHEITFEFTPPGFFTGIILSFSTLFIYILFIFIKQKLLKKKEIIEKSLIL